MVAEIDLHGMAFAARGGRQVGALETYALVSPLEAAGVQIVEKRIDLSLPPELHARVLAGGLPIMREFELASGRYQSRLLVRDPRLMLVRPSLYTGLAAVYLLGSVLAGRPLSYDGARPMAARGGPERLAAYERAWDNSPEFRRTHRLMTAGFGLALAADSVLRVVIVYAVPTARAAWLSNAPRVVAIVLFIGCSALAGRRFKRLVDRVEAGDDAPLGAKVSAGVSLLLWVGVMYWGRMLQFFGKSF